MTNPNWERQPGGLYLGVQPFDKTESDHRDAIADVLRASVQKVAKAHGASFSETGFRNNMRALFAGDIRADLFMAKWEICAPKSICIGAALNWDTFGITPDGRISRAIYTEDVCLLTNKIRELVREKPKGKYFPEESLAECFERISLQKMLMGNDAAFRFGEVNPDNTTMMRSLIGNGAIIGIGPDSAVLEFKTLPNDLLERVSMVVEPIDLKKNGKWDKDNFVVRWKDGRHDIRFIATKGQATAIGGSRVDIRPWHNGHLPEQGILECVIASSLLAIKMEAEDEKRKWGISMGQVVQNVPSPSIPLLASRPEIMSALYRASGDQLLINTIASSSTFAQRMPDAHIFVINDQQMLDAFVAVGAEPRLFGDKPMKPGVNIVDRGMKLAA